MANQNSSFGDFGIHSSQLKEPEGVVRAYFSTGRVIGQYIATGLVALTGVLLAVVFAFTMPGILGILATAATAMLFGLIVFLATRNDYRWIELEGNSLRAGHLYTGRVLERSIEEIESLSTMVLQVKTAAVSVVEGILGRVKGVEVRFRDGRTPLRILRADPAMTNAQELIMGLVYRMNELHATDSEVINFEGRPLVRRVFWQGETEFREYKRPYMIPMLLMGLVWMFAPILSYISTSLQHVYNVTSVPPQEITVRKLIQDGPGTNRHVLLTDYRPGGYVMEGKNGTWKNVYIAMFPRDANETEKKEIRLVLSSNSVGNEAALVQMMQKGKIAGICSDTTRSGWGTELGPNLIKANNNAKLASAWEINEVSERPDPGRIRSFWLAGMACFGVVLLLGLIVLWLLK